jgi:hypothetical protein
VIVARHPDHRCARCRELFADDATLYMTATEPNRYRNRTAPVCEQCLSPEEREIASSHCRALPPGRNGPARDIVPPHPSTGQLAHATADDAKFLC